MKVVVAHASMFGVLINPPKLSTCAKPTSSSKKMMMFGEPFAGRCSGAHHSLESE